MQGHQVSGSWQGPAQAVSSEGQSCTSSLGNLTPPAMYIVWDPKHTPVELEFRVVTFDAAGRGAEKDTSGEY